jgi:multiple sugar transport system permease protein
MPHLVRRLELGYTLMTKQMRQQLLTGWLFISPWVVGFLALTLYPAAASAYYSLTTYNALAPPEWVGLANYQRLFTSDPNFPVSLENTAYIAFIGVPLQLLVGIVTALVLNQKLLRGRTIYRTIYFLPTLMPVVASTILFIWILNPQFGIVDYLLGLIGLPQPGWFADPAWSKPAIILLSIWGIGTTTVIFLAGLQGINPELYEAAEIDGASWFHKTIHVTVPLLSPVTLFNLVVGLISAFQIFASVYLAGSGTSGSPEGSLLLYAVYLYANAFQYLQMGYASAMAWILFVIILVLTIIVMRTSRWWTYYEV